MVAVAVARVACDDDRARRRCNYRLAVAAGLGDVHALVEIVAALLVQIALTVDLIIERFWYFKLEEIKYCLRRAMMHEKVYDRLDGNIIIGWLTAYDAERTEEAMRASEQEDMQRLNATPAAEGAISLAEYMERLKQRADTDEEAARKLGVFTEMASQPTIRTKEEQTEKDNEFRKFKIDYIIRQNALRRNNGENL